jgi:flavin reductase (DIM6/NTAB) family NADH-FMN oxidoreductase RutF
MEPDVGARFDRLMGKLDGPMFVVTASAADGERSGCLVGFTTQCSIDPGRYLVCLSVTNHTHGVAARAGHLGVHLLPEDRLDLASRFGEHTGDDVDKFAGPDWSEGFAGVPILDGCPDWFVGRVLDRVPLGDHTGHLLDPVAASAVDGPLGFLTLRRAGSLDPGHPA